MSVRITKDQVPLLLQAIEGLTRQEVLVGIPGDVPARTAVAGKPPITNPVIGYLNEFGSPAANIPARPFLQPGVNNAIPAIIARLRAGAIKALAFPVDPDVGTRTLMGVGLLVQNSVRAVITGVIPPPLAASTLRARRTRKVAPRTGTVPLVDTGSLRRSISFVIRPK